MKAKKGKKMIKKENLMNENKCSTRRFLEYMCILDGREPRILNQ